MILDHRPDTLTPRLKKLTTFEDALPALLSAARARDSRLALLVRQALRDVFHYHLPLGFVHDGAWILALGEKLDTPNRFKAHWSMQSSSRDKWELLLRAAVLRALGVASWQHLAPLGRVPQCDRKMSMQVVRLVKSSREFIRDDDNLAFSRKHLQDCLKPLGLVKDDRREWLTANVIQDVAPNGHPITLVFLWPADADLF